MKPNDFALCPEEGYPRLIRFNLPNVGTGCVSQLDIEQNLLRVCKELYDECNNMQQNRVLMTKEPLLYMTDLSYFRT
jgi:hypothetical protein